jgi:N-acetylmuramoyl-L-alanine amidase
MALTITGGKITAATQQPGFSSAAGNTRTYVAIHYPATDTLAKTFSALKPSKCYHIVIDRNGDLHQLASFDRTGAHSGFSDWKGVERLNGHSIAISLQNVGAVQKSGTTFVSEGGMTFAAADVMQARPRLPTSGTGLRFWERFRPAQLDACEAVVRALVATYPTLIDCVGHDEISMGRRDDPGPDFPWARFRPLFPKASGDFGPVKRVKAGGAALRKTHDPGSSAIATLAAGTEVHLRSSVYKEHFTGGKLTSTTKTGIVAVATKGSLDHAGFMEAARLV